MREVRTVVYSQFLESYKSVTMEAMATAFGVTVDFIDQYVILLLQLPMNDNLVFSYCVVFIKSSFHLLQGTVTVHCSWEAALQD